MTFDDPTPETSLAMAGELRSYAEHFAPHDWDYTRDTGDLEHIRHRRDHSGHYRVDRRIRGALDALLGFHRKAQRPFADLQPRGLRSRWIVFKFRLGKDDNMPDGILDGGSIITHWEETGEYLQYVQPTVGSLIADWMEAEPDNPHALKIAGEMRRINKRYGDRLRSEAA